MVGPSTSIRDELEKGNSEHHAGSETEHIADVAERRSHEYADQRPDERSQYHDEEYRNNGRQKNKSLVLSVPCVR